MPKISIIVGAYNVSKFLREKQLGCILGQTYEDWELILVDDGSTDDTGALCEDFAKRDHRVRVLHQSNMGLGGARNAGIEAARGDYLWFYDVDDEVCPNLLAHCVEKMEATQAEVMVFGLTVITMSQNKEEAVHFKEKVILSQQELRACYLDDLLLVRYGNGYACNKVYRRSFINENALRFGDQRIQQDEVFNLKVYPKVERAYLSPEVLYTYYIYDQGNTRSRFIPDRFDIYVSIRDQFETLREQWSLADPRYDDYLNHRFYGCVDVCLRYNLFHPDCPWTKAEKKRELNRVVVHPYSRAALCYEKRQFRGLEQRLYMRQYERQDLGALRFWNAFFQKARRIKRALF